jgi:hypothetical protein
MPGHFDRGDGDIGRCASRRGARARPGAIRQCRSLDSVRPLCKPARARRGFGRGFRPEPRLHPRVRRRARGDNKYGSRYRSDRVSTDRARCAGRSGFGTVGCSAAGRNFAARTRCPGGNCAGHRDCTSGGSTDRYFAACTRQPSRNCAGRRDGTFGAACAHGSRSYLFARGGSSPCVGNSCGTDHEVASDAVGGTITSAGRERSTSGFDGIGSARGRDSFARGSGGCRSSGAFCSCCDASPSGGGRRASA